MSGSGWNQGIIVKGAKCLTVLSFWPRLVLGSRSSCSITCLGPSIPLPFAFKPSGVALHQWRRHWQSHRSIRQRQLFRNSFSVLKKLKTDIKQQKQKQYIRCHVTGKSRHRRHPSWSSVGLVFGFVSQVYCSCFFPIWEMSTCEVLLRVANDCDSQQALRRATTLEITSQRHRRNMTR